jgi:hypothetical protein
MRKKERTLLNDVLHGKLDCLRYSEFPGDVHLHQLYRIEELFRQIVRCNFGCQIEDLERLVPFIT